MSSPTERFLALVDAVKRKAGANHGVFRCPAHDDKHASATWAESSSGALLLHCFAGCSASEIVAAVGLTMADLFPPKESDGKSERRPFPASDVLRAIAFEATVVLCAAESMLTGKPLPPADLDRLSVAGARLQAALEAAGLGS